MRVLFVAVVSFSELLVFLHGYVVQHSTHSISVRKNIRTEMKLKDNHKEWYDKPKNILTSLLISTSLIITPVSLLNPLSPIIPIAVNSDAANAAAIPLQLVKVPFRFMAIAFKDIKDMYSNKQQSPGWEMARQKRTAGKIGIS